MSNHSWLPARLVGALALTGLLTTSFGFQSGGVVQRRGPSPYQMDQKDPAHHPKVYRIPLRGQMGTDINSAAYRNVIADVKTKQPDLIVFVLNAADIDSNEHLPNIDPEEFAKFDADDMRNLINAFKTEIGDIPAVVWVQDSVGFASLLAFAWPDLYMAPNARLYGLNNVFNMSTWTPDFEWHRKLYAAWESIAVGFFEAGGYPKALARGMIEAKHKLSVSWRGRELIWQEDDQGTYVVDDSTRSVAGFNAKIAEDLMLSKGTVEDLDDLLFALGYREWDRSLVDGNQDGARLTDDYIKRWRAAYERSLTSWDTYVREMGWASGDDALVHLGKARRALEEIKEAMERFPAVELRWMARRQPPRARLKDIEDLLEEVRGQIRQIEERRRGNRGTGGGGGGLGGGRGRGLGR
ncbi:MAG: hypothetical protein KF724_03830 [Phycisphaeraceae bacterium]|nr:hypothetical protein [Phycisphaeraceae bacterium]